MAANLDLLENRIRLLLTFGVARGSFIDQIGQRRGSIAAAGGGGSESRSLSVCGFSRDRKGDAR
jgi:hypothetical protein